MDAPLVQGTFSSALSIRFCSLWSSCPEDTLVFMPEQGAVILY